MKIPVQVGVIAHGNPTQMVLFMHEMIRRKEFGHVGTLCRPEIAKKITPIGKSTCVALVVLGLEAKLARHCQCADSPPDILAHPTILGPLVVHISHTNVRFISILAIAAKVIQVLQGYLLVAGVVVIEVLTAKAVSHGTKMCHVCGI
jgi:hypothetical protein